ncbi:MAG: helix-turn-helix domain-containing protein [Desulfomonilaceae bacterium]
MEKYYTPIQAAQELHVSDITMSRWLKAGKLEYIQISERRRLIAETELENFLSRRIVAPPKKIVDRPRDYDRPWTGPLENGSLAKEDDPGDKENGVKSLTKEIALLCR